MVDVSELDAALLQALYDEGLSRAEVARRVEVPAERLRYVVRRLGVRENPSSRAHVLTEELLTELWTGEGLDIKEIAERTGKQFSSVHQALVKYGLVTVGTPHDRSRFAWASTVLTEEYLRDRLGRGWTQAEVSVETGASFSTVLKRVRSLGLTPSSSTRGGTVIPHTSRLQDPRWVREEFTRKRRSVFSLALEEGVRPYVVAAALSAHGVPCTDRRHRTLWDPLTLWRVLVVELVSVEEAAEYFGGSSERVREHAARLGLRFVDEKLTSPVPLDVPAPSAVLVEVSG